MREAAPFSVHKVRSFPTIRGPFKRGNRISREILRQRESEREETDIEQFGFPTIGGPSLGLITKQIRTYWLPYPKGPCSYMVDTWALK